MKVLRPSQSRRTVDGKPSGAVFLQRKVLADRRLDLQFQCVVPARATCRGERVEGPAFVEVDQAERSITVVAKTHQRTQQRGSVSVDLQGRVDRMQVCDQPGDVGLGLFSFL